MLQPLVKQLLDSYANLRSYIFQQILNVQHDFQALTARSRQDCFIAPHFILFPILPPDQGGSGATLHSPSGGTRMDSAYPVTIKPSVPYVM